MSKPKFNYDRKNDILYISIDEPRPSYGDEIQEGIILRKDFTSDEITGITILDFMKRLECHDNQLESLSLLEGLANIDFKSIPVIN